MNRRIILWILLAGLLSSCGSRTSSRQLLEVDKLVGKMYELKDDHPDSALVLLNCFADTMDEDGLRRRNLELYYEYQVLVAELCYKNLMPIRNGRLLEEATVFYDSIIRYPISVSRNIRSTGFQYARAICYLSTIEEDSGRLVNAFTGYMQSMELIDALAGRHRFYYSDRNNDGYEIFTALLLRRMANVLYTYDAWSTASDALDLSTRSYEKAHNLKAVAQNYELKGDVMLAQGGFLKANDYYHQADSIFDLLPDVDVYHRYSSLIHRSLHLFGLGEFELAYSLLNQGLQNAERGWMARQIHYAMGFFFLSAQEMDSALAHYEKSFPLLPRQTTRSFSHIIRISNQLGDTAKAAYYGNLLAEYELARIGMNGEKIKMISMYDDYWAKKHELRRRDALCFISALVVLLAAMFVISSFLMHRRMLAHRSALEKQEQDRATLEGRIRSSLDESQRKEEKIKTLEYELKKSVNNPDFHSLPFDTKIETLTEIPVCKRILNIREASVKVGVAYPEWQLTDIQIKRLVYAVDSVFPKFSIRIIDLYPRLRYPDVVYCCLYILGINEIQAAALTGKSYQAVWKRSLKLHEIFQNKADLKYVLFDILKDWKTND